MSASMRAKMKVTSVEVFENSQNLVLNAVSRNDAYPEDGSDENNTFSKFTPSAELKMSITNPALQGKFAVGDVFYVDFTPVAVEIPVVEAPETVEEIVSDAGGTVEVIA